MGHRLRLLSDTALGPVLGGRLRISDVLTFPALRGAHVLAGDSGLSRALTRVNVMQVPTVALVRRDELILAASCAFDELDDPITLIDALDERGVAGLAARGSTLEKLGAAGLARADDRSLPLVELAAGSRLNSLLTELLETLVASQASHLRLVGAVRDELIDLVISDAGLPRLVRAIADLTAGSIAIIGSDGIALAVSDDGDREAAQEAAFAWIAEGWTAPADAGEGWILWPILAGGMHLGCVAARLPEPRQPLMLAAVQSGARSVAFEIVHELEEAATVRQLTEQFVRDLLVGTLDPVAASERANAAGWRAGTPFRVLLARSANGATEAASAAIRRLSPAALVMACDGDCLTLLPVPDGPNGAGDAAVLLMRELELELELVDVRLGLSGLHCELAQLPLAHAQALEAVACAECFGPRSRCCEFDPLSPLRMLSHVPVDKLQAFERDTLAPLDELEPDHGRMLTATLRLLVETGLNVAETARRGGWHYNTVRYRVARLTELLGPFMEDGTRLDALMLALLLRREVRADNGRR
ncbi:MAG: PucR family transcriptional regulator ligand-binding domain-containing protein [Solirubrobacterales bacterium]|nr:PucR family transcriptional regulator ligand-binding domain-containing protein [Solirubrobacterales bacterium]